MTSYRTFVSSLLLVSSLGVLAAPVVAAPPDCSRMGMRGDAWEYRVERMAQHLVRLLEAALSAWRSITSGCTTL